MPGAGDGEGDGDGLGEGLGDGIVCPGIELECPPETLHAAVAAAAKRAQMKHAKAGRYIAFSLPSTLNGAASRSGAMTPVKQEFERPASALGRLPGFDQSFTIRFPGSG